MATIEDIRRIAKTMDFYDAVTKGVVKDKCVAYLRELKNALMDAGIPTIMVGGDAYTGKIKHNYLFCETDDGILLVDPTAGQFIPALNGDIYIGSRKELLDLGHKHNVAEDWSGIWSQTPFLWKRGGETYDAKRTAEFERQWGSTGTKIDIVRQNPVQNIRI